METLKKVWSWVKVNWKWLLFPVGITLFVFGRLSGSRGTVTIDPTSEADVRTEAERERRQAELAEEKARLRTRLAEVHEEHKRTLQKLSEEQMAQAAELEGDPEALSAWLRSL